MEVDEILGGEPGPVGQHLYVVGGQLRLGERLQHLVAAQGVDGDARDVVTEAEQFDQGPQEGGAAVRDVHRGAVEDAGRGGEGVRDHSGEKQGVRGGARRGDDLRRLVLVAVRQGQQLGRARLYAAHGDHLVDQVLGAYHADRERHGPVSVLLGSTHDLRGLTHVLPGFDARSFEVDA